MPLDRVWRVLRLLHGQWHIVYTQPLHAAHGFVLRDRRIVQQHDFGKLHRHLDQRCILHT